MAIAEADSESRHVGLVDLDRHLVGDERIGEFQCRSDESRTESSHSRIVVECDICEMDLVRFQVVERLIIKRKHGDVLDDQIGHVLEKESLNVDEINILHLHFRETRLECSDFGFQLFKIY